MLGDGERRLGSHQAVARIMAVSAHLTQDAGWAHTGKETAQKKITMHAQKSVKEKKHFSRNS